MNSRLSGCLPIALAVLLAACSSDGPAERYARAAAGFQAGDYAMASIDLRNLLQQNPDHLEARLLYGRTLLATGESAQAVRELEAARELGATVEQLAIPLGLALAETGRTDAAADELESLPDRERDADWHTAWAQVLVIDGFNEAARDAYQQALAIDASHYEALLGLARLTASRLDPDAAFAIADRAIAANPQRPDAYELRGHLHLRARNVIAAEADLSAAARRFATGSVTVGELNNLLMLTQLQFRLGRADALASTATLAGARSSGSAVALFAEGAALFLRGEYRDATNTLQRALNQSPNEPAIRSMLGASSLASRNFGQAEQHLLAVLELRPGDAGAMRLLAETRRRQGRPEAALDVLDRMGEAANDPGTLAMRGLLHLETGDPGQAVALLERAGSAAPADIGVRLQLARAYIASGRHDDAAELFAAPLGEGSERAVAFASELLSHPANREDSSPRELARTAIAEQGETAANLMGAGLFLQVLGEDEPSRAMFERAAQADPAFTPVRLVLAAQALSAADHARARSLYESVTRGSPNEHRAWLGLARVALAGEAIDEAATFAARAAEVAPDQVAPWLGVAQLSLLADDVAAAEQAVGSALNLAPDNGEALTLAAEVAMRMDAPRQALAHLRRAADLEPGRPDRWANLARVQRELDDADGARESLLRVAALAPSNAAARYELAQAELASGNTASARRIAQDLQADFPDMAAGFLLEASILMDTGGYERAAALFESAYQRRPGFEAAFGVFHARRSGGMSDADAMLRRWLEASPDDVQAWLVLADHHQSRDETGPALAAYERALRLQPEHVIALNNAAWMYIGQNDARGLAYAERAHRLAPRAAPVLDTYGWALLQAGELDAALARLGEAAGLAPEAPDIQYHHAYALAQAGRGSEARGILERLLADSGSSAVHERARALLADL